MGESEAAIMLIFASYAVIAACAGAYRVYEKAGFPGWSALVPVYSEIILIRIVDRPPGWIWFLFIPGANIVIGIILLVDLAERFEKGPLYGVGLFLLPFFFFPLLGFGRAGQR